MPFLRKNTSNNAARTHTDTRGQDVWHPYVNDASKAQEILEVLSVLIILASVPCFLGSIYGIFVAGYGFAIGVMGLLAWTRRHCIFLILSLVAFTIWLIVVIILNAIGSISKSMPFVEGTVIAGVDTDSGRYNGSRVLTYITHGILIFLSILALIFAIKVCRERRPEPGALVHQTTTTTKTMPGEPMVVN
ncbi:hypothetical protein PROFUN_11875 [Planoprotostelium fungivorum]|uniref:Transmembrane protein n=1 Tax=Planoprotostelium fungivorum TaxID=1890364 RepID=A0A2P6N9E0_9EUKA|nr:hypothetical protein PROFUN_11875 [Planoprotostelium fungivorum]